LRRLASSVVFRNARARLDLTRRAGRELGLMLADDDHRGRRGRLELFGIEVPAAGNAVDVPVLVLVAAARSLSLLLAFGESFLALRHEGVGGFHEIRPLASVRATQA
jgi:hypothetical protein